MAFTLRARAPLRLGLAGGGTDVSPFPETHGGCVLNVTIDRFAFASIEPRTDGRIVLRAADLDVEEEVEAAARLPIDGPLKLHRGVYNRMVAMFNDGRAAAVTLTTGVDAPIGSGLGSSTALVVAMVEAFRELFDAPLGEYDVARLAYDIERIDLQLMGGRQDQYASTFGGVNFMEFGDAERVIVNPLRVRPGTLRELESSLVLMFTGVSRESARIIDQQSAAVGRGGDPLKALHDVKQSALRMKDALLSGNLARVAEILEEAWDAKKRTASVVSNTRIDELFDLAKSHGAIAGKVSGAGGGGFMMFLVEPTRRPYLLRGLASAPGTTVTTCRLTDEGVVTWRT